MSEPFSYGLAYAGITFHVVEAGTRVPSVEGDIVVDDDTGALNGREAYVTRRVWDALKVKTSPLHPSPLDGETTDERTRR